MKTAIYINEGTTQVVLTPENEWEKTIVRMLLNPSISLEKFSGSFYDCQGGWMRYRESSDESLIFRLNKVADVPLKIEFPNEVGA